MLLVTHSLSALQWQLRARRKGRGKIVHTLGTEQASGRGSTKLRFLAEFQPRLLPRTVLANHLLRSSVDKADLSKSVNSNRNHSPADLGVVHHLRSS